MLKSVLLGTFLYINGLVEKNDYLQFAADVGAMSPFLKDLVQLMIAVTVGFVIALVISQPPVMLAIGMGVGAVCGIAASSMISYSFFHKPRIKLSETISRLGEEAVSALCPSSN